MSELLEMMWENHKEINRVGALGEVVVSISYQIKGIEFTFDSGKSIEFYSDSPIKVRASNNNKEKL